MNKGFSTIQIIGLFFSIIGIISFVNGFLNSSISGLLWFSYIAFFLIGIGMLTRNSYLIASQLNIIIIPYIFWNIDFFYHFIYGQPLWGITNYFFTNRTAVSQIITLQHVIIIPLALIAIAKNKLKKTDFWKLSAIQTGIYFLLVKTLTEKEQNINCVFANCLSFQIPSDIYPLFWIFGYVLIISLTTLFLSKTKIFCKK